LVVVWLLFVVCCWCCCWCCCCWLVGWCHSTK
jgi:hypothetical protein